MTKAFGQLFLIAVPTVLTMPVDADQVVAGHAGLARDAGGDDDDVGALEIGIIVRPEIIGVEAVDRRGLGDIERLALRNALDHVDEGDVAKLLEAGEEG